jgi:hypothetical protein
MGANLPAMRKNFESQSCPADLQMYDSGIDPAGTKASFAQVIKAAAPHARVVHFADTDHFDPSVRGVMDNRENLEALRTSGFSDIAIEAPHWLQRWNDKLVDGAVTRPEFEENIHRALSGTQGNGDGSWTRQIGMTAEYARDNGMRFHFADPQNGGKWCDESKPDAEVQACEKEATLDRYDDRGGLGPFLKDPAKEKTFLMYGAAHFSLDNGSRESTGGSYLKIDVYKDRPAYEGSKDVYKADNDQGIPTNKLKPDLIYLIDEQRVYTTCDTDPALKKDIEAIGPEKQAPVLAPPPPPAPAVQRQAVAAPV